MRLHLYDSPRGTYLGFTNRILEAGGDEEVTEFLESKNYTVTERVRGPLGGLVHMYAEVVPPLRNEDIIALEGLAILHLGRTEDLTVFDIRGVRPSLLTEHEIQSGRIAA